MSSGWGCQHLTTYKEEKEWCRLLKHKCKPGCKGCVLYGNFMITEENIPSKEENETRKVKNRFNTPLG